MQTNTHGYEIGEMSITTKLDRCLRREVIINIMPLSIDGKSVIYYNSSHVTEV